MLVNFLIKRAEIPNWRFQKKFRNWEFFASNNNFLKISVLPNSLLSFMCSGNKLKKLPILPIKLQVLFCYSNRIKDLPILPDSIRNIHV